MESQFIKPYDDLNIELRVGSVLCALRENKGLKQEDLAQKVGLNQSSISKLENGKITLPLNKMREIAFALNQTLSSIIERAERIGTPSDVYNDMLLLLEKYR